jgi:subtilisin family serine protease
VARGHLVVAAVGNDGPAAPPLYPAAYAQTHAGVVAVTGTDARRRVLPEAGRGPYLVFAAPGSDLAAAHQGDAAFIQVRGTSFAAPLVAGLLAQALPRPDAGAAVQAVSTLAATAVDLGAAGRDPVYGHGLVGESLRVDPAAVRLAGAR